jgi:hypothetical protein
MTHILLKYGVAAVIAVSIAALGGPKVEEAFNSTVTRFCPLSICHGGPR